MKVNYIIILFSITCCSNSSLKTSEITSEKVTQVLPNLDNENKLMSYDTSSVQMYFYKNLVLYELSYRFDSIVNNKTLISEDRTHYFVYEKGKTFGFDYDEHKSIYKKRISLDSIFKFEWIAQNKLYPLFLDNPTLLVSSHKNQDSGTLHEKYIIRYKNDTSTTGTCSLSFSNNLKDVRYSISKELDSIKNMKLYSFKTERYAGYIQGIYVDAYITSTLLEKVSVSNPKKIMSYFNMYRKEEDAK
jgi:hypothetical protein